MAERKSTFLNMVLTLFLVTSVSAFILGFVQDMTHDAIVASKMKTQNDAIRSVLPEYTTLGNAIKAVPKEGGDSLEIFPAYNQSEELIGVAVKSYSKNGFGGLIQVMVGFRPDGTITGYQVLDHKETPGLGSKMDSWFNNAGKPGQQIIGRNPGTDKLTVKKDGGEVDAITASTITSRAFLEAVRRAYHTWESRHDITGAAITISSPNKPTDGGPAL